MWLLNYSASHRISIVHYKTSGTIVQIFADASYLSVSRAHIRSGGYHYLGNKLDDPPNNGDINTIFKIVMNVMGLAADAEIGSTYINAQDAALVKTCLINMGHPQPPSKLQIYNNTT